MTDGDTPRVHAGAAVYDAEGGELGTVRDLDEDCFYVTTAEGIQSVSVEHERAGGAWGEAELAWRCADCGEMGDIDALPDTCPNCGPPREALYYWTED